MDQRQHVSAAIEVHVAEKVPQLFEAYENAQSICRRIQGSGSVQRFAWYFVSLWQGLKEEQKNDDAQKAFCDKDMAAKEEEQKDTESAISTSEAFIEETTAASEETAEEIAALQKDIKVSVAGTGIQSNRSLDMICCSMKYE